MTGPPRPSSCLVVLNLACARCASERWTAASLRERLAASGVAAEVVAVRPAALDGTLVSRLPKEPALVVAGGGDGTVRTVAAAVAETHHTLGVLPLGTVNHFARDLEIPLELEPAMAVLASGEDRQVDLGEVNGVLFLNACVLGVYAELVRLREHRRRAHAHWPAPLRWVADTTVSASRVLRSWRLLRLDLELDGEHLEHRLPLLLIANNPLPRVSEHRRLDGGRLAIYVPRRIRPLPLLGVLLKAVVLGAERVDPVTVHQVGQAVIELPRRTRVVIDGEVHNLSPPLRVRCRRAACRVRVPAVRTATGQAP